MGKKTNRKHFFCLHHYFTKEGSVKDMEPAAPRSGRKEHRSSESKNENRAEKESSFGHDEYTIYERERKSTRSSRAGLETFDKLEEYLDYIYENKCKWKTSNEEVQFIENALEIFVRLQMDKYYMYMNWFKDEKCCIDHCYPQLLKVGSFYESTKNIFPNEFDYLWVIGNVTEMPNAPCQKAHILSPSDIIFQLNKDKNTSIQFFESDYHGPAKKFSFWYYRGREKFQIDIDVTVAVRCTAENLLKESEVYPSEFYRNVLETGSFLFIKPNLLVTHDETGIHGSWKFSITETEKAFMKETLSEKHRKAYRILKYLMNGQSNDKLLKHLSKTFSYSISSYNIKSAIIHHHYFCERRGSDVADCVLDILKQFEVKIEHALTKVQTFPSRIDVKQENLLAFKFSNRKFVEEREYQSTIETEKMLTYMYGCQIRMVEPSMISGSRTEVEIVADCFNTFINRLNLLREDPSFSKCKSAANDSLLEMISAVPIFQKYIDNSPSILEHLVNDGNGMGDDSHSQSYEEKLSDCLWCDFGQTTSHSAESELSN